MLNTGYGQSRIQKVSDNVFFFFFLVDEGREDPNSTKSGPLSRGRTGGPDPPENHKKIAFLSNSGTDP